VERIDLCGHGRYFALPQARRNSLIDQPARIGAGAGATIRASRAGTSPYIVIESVGMRHLTYVPLCNAPYCSQNHDERRKMAIQKLMVVDPGLFKKMASAIPCQRPDVIQDRFGIGVNTWAKIRNGQAIRQSVAARLIARLEREQFI
jgi:hypothetical protein